MKVQAAALARILIGVRVNHGDRRPVSPGYTELGERASGVCRDGHPCGQTLNNPKVHGARAPGSCRRDGTVTLPRSMKMGNGFGLVNTRSIFLVAPGYKGGMKPPEIENTALFVSEK